MWEYISIENLLDIVDNFPLLSKNEAFQNIFKNEILRRFQGREALTIPRKCYKYQINTEVSQPFFSLLVDALFDQKKELSKLVNKVIDNT